MMVRRMAWVSALLFAMAALSTAADELVVFKDFRALIVQSHRVEGDWTYLRIGSGEMAVPSATILKFDHEQGVSAATAARAPYFAPPSAMTAPPQQGQPMVTPPPFPSGFPNRVRQLPPDQPVPEDQDDEEEKGDVTDEETESEAPVLPPQVPGKMPIMNPNFLQKGPTPQTQQPIDQQR